MQKALELNWIGVASHKEYKKALLDYGITPEPPESLNKPASCSRRWLPSLHFGPIPLVLVLPSSFRKVCVWGASLDLFMSNFIDRAHEIFLQNQMVSYLVPCTLGWLQCWKA